MSATIFRAGDGVTPLVFSINPVYPGRVEVHSGLVRAVTEGGEEYAYRKGPGSAIYGLRFEGMPAADFDGGFDYAANQQAPGTQSLVNWFCNVAPSSGGTFTYQDAFGKEHAVRIPDARLEFSLSGHGAYDGTVALMEALG